VQTMNDDLTDTKVRVSVTHDDGEVYLAKAGK
jgi:hypothetical protein